MVYKKSVKTKMSQPNQSKDRGHMHKIQRKREQKNNRRDTPRLPGTYLNGKLIKLCHQAIYSRRYANKSNNLLWPGDCSMKHQPPAEARSNQYLETEAHCSEEEFLFLSGKGWTNFIECIYFLPLYPLAPRLLIIGTK